MSRQYVRDLVDDGTPRAVETAGGGVAWRATSHAMRAYRSCARQLDLPVEIVLRAASTNRLGQLIEARKGSTRSIENRNTARIAALDRKKQLGLLLERDALLRPPWPTAGRSSRPAARPPRPKSERK